MAARMTTISIAALLCSMALQGCDVNVPRHGVGNWESKENYLTKFQYMIPAMGSKPATAILNSCNNAAIPIEMQCTGHGRCMPWNNVKTTSAMGVNNPKELRFCECDQDWADPECNTQRKSQMTAFFLTLFLGVFAAEDFYLGYFWYGVIKLIFYCSILMCLFTTGRLSWKFQDETAGHGRFFLLDLATFLAGFLYLYDLCRTGSAPPNTTQSFRCAQDLSHFSFVLSTVSLMVFFGFISSTKSIQDARKCKAHELLLHRLAEQQEEKALMDQPDPQYGSMNSARIIKTDSVYTEVPSDQRLPPPMHFQDSLRP